MKKDDARRQLGKSDSQMAHQFGAVGRRAVPGDGAAVVVLPAARLIAWGLISIWFLYRIVAHMRMNAGKPITP